MTSEPTFYYDPKIGRVHWEHICTGHADTWGMDRPIPQDLPVVGGSLPHSESGWTIAQVEPLTVTPSIRCSCGVHGFITNGRWVPA